MRRFIPASLFAFILTFSLVAPVEARYYGKKLCHEPGYECKRIKRGQSWHRLFPNDQHRDIVKRVNRMNTALRPGMLIAVPNNLEQLTIYDVSPFPRYIDSPGEKVIHVDQATLAWAAYSASGELVWWGPISGGKDYCADVGESCNTPSGEYRVIRKQGFECESSKYPLPFGGAPMPYCMHFFGGYAMHASHAVPGYSASHGCVRLFHDDAKWLNQQFIDLPGTGKKGTRVIIDRFPV